MDNLDRDNLTVADGCGGAWPACGAGCEKLAEVNKSLQRYAAIVRADLERARKVQRAMLADIEAMPLPERLLWSAAYRPAAEVGGDFYDARLIGPSRVAVIFGDVSGHGMAAALVTGMIKSAFQWWRPEQMALTVFAAELNAKLIGLLPDGAFAALVLGVYDDTDASFTYINGGHNPEPWLLPGNREKPLARLDQARGVLLGVLEDWRFHSARIELRRGDTLLMITDGIVDARNRDREFFGERAIAGLAAALAGRPADEIVYRLDSLVESYTDGAPGRDDRTILAMQLR